MYMFAQPIYAYIGHIGSILGLPRLTIYDFCFSIRILIIVGMWDYWVQTAQLLPQK